MLAYQGEAEDHGAVIAFNSRAVRGRVLADGMALTIEDNLQGDGGGKLELACNKLVNAAGRYDTPQSIIHITRCRQIKT